LSVSIHTHIYALYAGLVITVRHSNAYTVVRAINVSTKKVSFVGPESPKSHRLFALC